MLGRKGHVFFRFLATCCLSAALLAGANSGESEQWQPVATLRFGNLDALDAEDGDLARFIRSIRNDGRFVPPLRRLIGPIIKNPTFYGLDQDAWLECTVAASTRPGPLRSVWIFPVAGRDEYLTFLADHGLSEYEGMDGVTELRETDTDGNFSTWHLEWLPGNVALFSADRSALSAVRQYYAENGAALGLLAERAGRYAESDISLRVEPRVFAAWQDGETGRYWWRETINALMRDLVLYWQPNPARQRLIVTLADAFAAWPQKIGSIDCKLWFEERGVEWRLEVMGDFAPLPPRSQLASLRRLPERSAMGYAMTFSPETFGLLLDEIGATFLGAAGGVITQESRTLVQEVSGTLARLAPRQAAAAWVLPPAGRPELGGSRMLLLEWQRPELLSVLWQAVQSALAPGSRLTQTLAQIGWEVRVDTDLLESGAVEIRIYPYGDANAEPYYRAVFVHRQNAALSVVVVGESRVDAVERDLVLRHRVELAEAALAYSGEGSVDSRSAFVHLGRQGAAALGFLDPVRLAQFALVEAADWRPRGLDQPEILSTQLARESLDYGSAPAWSFAVEKETGLWRGSGGIPWRNLTRLSAALGITEASDVD